jgi:hypothetical protein
VLTGNDIADLASLFELPDDEKIEEYIKRHPEIQSISTGERHKKAQELIRKHQQEDALCLLLSKE